MGVLLLSAAALWGSARLVWIEVPPGTTVDGAVTGDLTGSDLAAWPTPIALFGLAAVAAALGARGWARRVLGVLLLAVGVWVLWLTLGGSAYDVTWTGRAPGYGSEPGEPVRTLWGPAAAVTGGVLMAAGGALLTWRGHRMPRMGARYAAPGTQRARKDPDTELWDALSDGDDPTTRS
ncbi:Trp biosynthesis-associated membrane protein [Prauserella muralis]|uniref:Trp biosynthesis-associated membrane protein n=1 Tax=Prauserella muralis TaxID=588067 RepID=UPI001FE34A01|nr:Trp biosynthesis-associated membrane protein [Prauserella muralis]